MKKLFIIQLTITIGLMTACYEASFPEEPLKDEDSFTEENALTEESTSLTTYTVTEENEEPEDEADIITVIHKNIFCELYKKSAGKNLRTSDTFEHTISGPEGGTAQVIKSKVRNVENNFPYYDDKYEITCSSYQENGHIVNGSISFYTGKRYDSIASPYTVDFIYAGGGEGGSIEVTGVTSVIIPVEIEVLNMKDGIEYHFNEVLVVNYDVQGGGKKEIKMLAGLYRKTFRDALLALTMTGSNDEIIIINGPQGGTAALNISRTLNGANTIQTETFSFSDYKDNDLILNSTLSWSFTYDTSNGEIIEGCNEEYNMEVTGHYETTVKHILIIDKPFSIWNFRMGYFVNGFYFESVSVRLNVGVGVGK